MLRIRFFQLILSFILQSFCSESKVESVFHTDIDQIPVKSEGTHKYSFTQLGTIGLKVDSPINKQIEQKLNAKESPVYHFNEFGGIDFLCRFTCEPAYYDYFSSGQIFLKGDPAEKTVTSCEFVSNGYIELQALQKNASRYYIQPYGTIPQYKFIAVGDITLSGCCIEGGDYVYYNFSAKGTFILVENKPPSATNPLIPSVKSLPIPKAEYLKRMEKYIKDKYWKEKHPELIQVEQTLSAIYENFDDFEHLCIFTGNAIFTTGGFLHLKQVDAKLGDKWCSRGIIMVKLEENYLKMAEESGHFELHDDPDLVASLSNISVASSLKFYNYLINEAQKADPAFKITWENVLKVLNTEEVQPEFEKKFAVNKKNRHEEYETVKSVLMVK